MSLRQRLLNTFILLIKFKINNILVRVIHLCRTYGTKNQYKTNNGRLKPTATEKIPCLRAFLQNTDFKKSKKF